MRLNCDITNTTASGGYKFSVLCLLLAATVALADTEGAGPGNASDQSVTEDTALRYEPLSDEQLYVLAAVVTTNEYLRTGDTEQAREVLRAGRSHFKSAEQIAIYNYYYGLVSSCDLRHSSEEAGPSQAAVTSTLFNIAKQDYQEALNELNPLLRMVNQSSDDPLQKQTIRILVDYLRFRVQGNDNGLASTATNYQGFQSRIMEASRIGQSISDYFQQHSRFPTSLDNIDADMGLATHYLYRGGSVSMPVSDEPIAVEQAAGRTEQGTIFIFADGHVESVRDPSRASSLLRKFRSP